MAIRIDIVDHATYYRNAPHPATVYDSAAFVNTVASERCRDVAYVLASDDTGNVLGMVWGLCPENRAWLSPFSAPYALCSTAAGGTSVYPAHIRAIAEHIDNMSGGRWQMTLPPDFYNPELVGCFAEAFMSYGVEKFTDRNYAHPVEAVLAPVARRNLRKAVQHGSFSLVTDAPPAEVYNLIAAHHLQLGYAMAMSRQQVLDTAKAIPMDFFMVMDGGVPAAAAYYQHTAPHIVQMINWGDTAQSRPLRVTNWMDHAISQHYAKCGIATIDLGPGTHHGIPNEGLERFKTSLGCAVSPKHTICGRSL